MKKIIIITLIQFSSALVSLNSLAGTASCAASQFGNDNLLDLRVITKEIEELFVEGSCDSRREMPKTEKVESTLWSQNGIGKVTKIESSSEEMNSVLSKENSSYGTGFMISPCHMITNHHVISKNAISMGQKVRFSMMGSNEKFKNHFIAEVVATGSFVQNEDNSTEDFAVTEISSLRGFKDVPHIQPHFTSTVKLNDGSLISPVFQKDSPVQDIGLVVGYPGMLSNGAKNSALFASKTRIAKSGPLLKTMAVVTGGNSGGVLEVMNGEKFLAIGLVIGSKKFDVNLNGPLVQQNVEHEPLNKRPRILSLEYVGERLAKINPTLYAEILEANRTGFCKK